MEPAATYRSVLRDHGRPRGPTGAQNPRRLQIRSERPPQHCSPFPSRLVRKATDTARTAG